MKIKWHNLKQLLLKNNALFTSVIEDLEKKSVNHSLTDGLIFSFAISDLEGRIDFAQRAFADLSIMLRQSNYTAEVPELIENSVNKKYNFVIPPNFYFGSLGDAIDHGKYDIRLQNALIDSPNSFHLIGNRDANKVRMLIECKDKEVIISNALLNNVGAWNSDNRNRCNSKTCLLAILLDMLASNIKNLDEEVIAALEVHGFANKDAFLLEHVNPAQNTSKEIPLKIYSREYLLALSEISKILNKVPLHDLQVAAIKWTLDYTMGCIKTNLWNSAWENRASEITELSNKLLTGKEIEQLVIDSYVNPNNEYNKNIKYLEKSLMAHRFGNVLSVHGCLVPDSFKLPGTDLDIDSFDHIDEWIEAINAWFRVSLHKLISGDELQQDDLSIFSYVVRSGLGGAKTNVDFLLKEYANQIESYKCLSISEQVAFVPYIKKIENMRERLETLKEYDGKGSIIGNNHYEKNDGLSSGENYKEIGFELDKSIIDLLRKSNIRTVRVGHAPTADSGFAGMAMYKDNGNIYRSDIEIISIDPTYADQNGTSLSSLSVFYGNESKTIIISRRNSSAEVDFSSIDSEGKRRLIDPNSMHLTKNEFKFKFSDNIFVTCKNTKGIDYNTVKIEEYYKHENKEFYAQGLGAISSLILPQYLRNKNLNMNQDSSVEDDVKPAKKCKF